MQAGSLYCCIEHCHALCYNVVTGYEKRDHFAQNAIFWHFQTVTIQMPQDPRASDLVS